MRLINADAFKEQVAEMTLHGVPVDKANAMLKLIDAQPTAYDPEEIVERLKSEGCIVDNEAGNRAVEIIMKGGHQYGMRKDNNI